jgi:tRNA U34 2-thiouridine synthase MnmA/TrmU
MWQYLLLLSGEVIAKHKGIHQWTLGQSCPIGGRPDRVFVVEKDVKNNVLRVCHGKDHPALFSEHFFTGDPHWISGQPDDLRHGAKSLECEFRFQNTQPLTKVGSCSNNVCKLDLYSVAKSWE